MTAIQILVTVFGVLMALDVVQTYYVPRFGLKEGNPWMAKLLAQEGFDGLVLAKYIVFFAVVVAAGQGWASSTFLYVIVSFQLGVVCWNAYKMLRNQFKE